MVMKCVLWSCERCPTVISQQSLKFLRYILGTVYSPGFAVAIAISEKVPTIYSTVLCGKYFPLLMFLVSEQVQEQRWMLQNFFPLPSAVLFFPLDVDAVMFPKCHKIRTAICDVILFPWSLPKATENGILFLVQFSGGIGDSLFCMGELGIPGLLLEVHFSAPKRGAVNSANSVYIRVGSWLDHMWDRKWSKILLKVMVVPGLQLCKPRGFLLVGKLEPDGRLTGAHKGETPVIPGSPGTGRGILSAQQTYICTCIIPAVF